MLVRISKLGQSGDIHFADTASHSALCSTEQFCDTELSAAKQGAWQQVSCSRCIELEREWKAMHRSALEVLQQSQHEAAMIHYMREQLLQTMSGFAHGYDHATIISVIKSAYGIELSEKDVSDIILDLTGKS